MINFKYTLTNEKVMSETDWKLRENEILWSKALLNLRKPSAI